MNATIKFIKEFFINVNPFNKNNNVSTYFYVIKKILAFILIYFASILIAEVLAISLHLILGYNLFQGEMLSIQTMKLMKYYGYGVHIIVVILYCKIFENRSIRTLGFNKKYIEYFKGIIIAILLLTVCIGLNILVGTIKFNVLCKSIDYTIIIAFMGGFIVQGAMEEIFCRGFLMKSLSKRVTITMSIFISSFLFALPHFPSLFQADFVYCITGVINLFLISIIFSLYIINHGNIYVACGLHSFWNFILLNVCGLNLSGIDEHSTSIFSLSTNGNNIFNGGQYGIETSIFTTLTLSLCAILLYIRFKKLGIKEIVF